MAGAVAGMTVNARDALMGSLESLLGSLLAKHGCRPFGSCKTCKCFVAREIGGYCSLLSQDLSITDITRICHEQVSA